MSLPRGTFRHQLRAASLLARYLPIFAGVVLATAFTLSVLYDGSDIARAAWITGDELLGMFGGFGLVALPAIFLASAVARRGVARSIRRIEDRGGEIRILLDRGRRATLNRDRVRSAFAEDLEDGRVRVSLELAGGITDGDRVVMELDREAAEPIVRGFVGGAPRYDLVSEGWALGFSLTALATAAGAALAYALMGRVGAVVEGMSPEGLEGVGAGFALGLTVACVGFTRALVALLVSPPDVVLGVDGVRIEGLLRRRFVPYASIASVAATDNWLHLELTSGQLLSIAALGAGVARTRAIADRIACRLGEPAPSTARLPALGLASVRTWREAIEGLARRDGYRDMALSNEALASSLTTPGLSCEARVATAIALLARGEEPTRIRIAASAVADDTTRALLERLAEGEADDAVLEALMMRRQRC